MTNTTNNTNDVAVQENGVELVSSKVVRETKDYTILQTSEGKFVRKAKYHTYSSITAATREEKIWLMNMLEGDSEIGNGLKDCVGQVIEVQDIVTRPYDKINEDTGEMEYGVLTYLIDPKKEVYVTSSKAVYFSLQTMLEMFGRPNDELWENLKITVLKEKREKGDALKIKMIG